MVWFVRMGEKQGERQNTDRISASNYCSVVGGLLMKSC
jgi:hypothetical protein